MDKKKLFGDLAGEGLFSSEGYRPAIHHCAKCGTGYAGPECKSILTGEPLTEAELDELTNPHKPGTILRVGPSAFRYLDRAGADEQELNENTVRRLIHGIIGEKERGGLEETPARVVKAWKHWTNGYHVDIPGLLKVFEDGAEGYDEMVVRKNIRIYSHCEHHLAPIIGDCTIAYIPDGKVVGLSKLDRLADAFARRLQVQERMTSQIADALMEHLQPKGVGVHINARHLCVESRGVEQHNSDTITSALRGVMKTQPETRAEFMALVNSK
jgi:GTP cyclohydrolase I